MANPTIDTNTIARRKPIGEALNTKDSVLPVLPLNKHNTTPPTLANGDVVEDQCDDMGNKLIALGDSAQVSSLSNPLVQGEYNATPPTLTTGQTDALQLDVKGNLKITDVGNLAIPSHDYIDWSDSSAIKFYSGGSGGTLVATLTLTAISVEKT